MANTTHSASRKNQNHTRNRKQLIHFHLNVPETNAAKTLILNASQSMNLKTAIWRRAGGKNAFMVSICTTKTILLIQKHRRKIIATLTKNVAFPNTISAIMYIVGDKKSFGEHFLFLYFCNMPMKRYCSIHDRWY